MSLTITVPSPSTLQISGYDPQERMILSVLTKRTYQITPQGSCVLAAEQLPLVLDAEDDPGRPGVYAHDPDIFPFKCATDVVVRGHAWAPTVGPRFTVELGVAGVTRTIQVVGDRQCTISATGRLVFSAPAPVRSVPLRFDHAYGGHDRVNEARVADPAELLRPYLPPGLDPSAASRYRYPRNPCGRGYVIEATREAVAQLMLPNLEDPRDLLTPERLAVGAVGRWPAMPMPYAFGFVDPTWFPRVAYFGVLPDFEPFQGSIPEVDRGYVRSDIMKPGTQEEKFDFRFANAASPMLQLPFLAADERFRLQNLDPERPRFELRLPGERPKIWIDGREGRLLPTEPVIHTVLLDLDAHRVTVLWRGSGPARRPYTSAELATMPFRVAW